MSGWQALPLGVFDEQAWAYAVNVFSLDSKGYGSLIPTSIGFGRHSWWGRSKKQLVELQQKAVGGAAAKSSWWSCSKKQLVELQQKAVGGAAAKDCCQGCQHKTV